MRWLKKLVNESKIRSGYSNIGKLNEKGFEVAQAMIKHKIHILCLHETR